MPATLTPPKTRRRSSSGSGLGSHWRVIVLNDSHSTLNEATVPLNGIGGGNQVSVPEESRQLSLDAGGILTDDFAPYEMHIYLASIGGVAPAARSRSAAGT